MLDFLGSVNICLGVIGNVINVEIIHAILVEIFNVAEIGFQLFKYRSGPWSSIQNITVERLKEIQILVFFHF